LLDVDDLPTGQLGQMRGSELQSMSTIHHSVVRGANVCIHTFSLSGFDAIFNWSILRCVRVEKLKRQSLFCLRE